MGFKIKKIAAPVKKVAKQAAKAYVAPFVGTAVAATSIAKGDTKGALSGYSMMAVGSSPSGYIEGTLGTNYTGAGGLAQGDVSKENVTKYALTGLAAGAGAAAGSASTGATTYAAGSQLAEGNVAGAAGTVIGSGELKGLVPEELFQFKNAAAPYLGMLRKPAQAGLGETSALTAGEAFAEGQSPLPLIIFGAALIGAVIYFKRKRK